MLTLVEEIVLLMLRDDDGRFVPVSSWSMEYAIAAGVLMDLAMENRIDTDLEILILVDSTPIGDSLLDPTLADIAEVEKNSVEKNDAQFWLERTAPRVSAIRDEALSRLIDVGILERQDDRFMWVFKSRRYPTIDGKAVREVKLRIMGVLFSDEIPDPRDVMIICLADACGIFKELLSSREIRQASERIEQVSRLELIGRSMSQAIREIELSIATSVHGHVY